MSVRLGGRGEKTPWAPLALPHTPLSSLVVLQPPRRVLHLATPTTSQQIRAVLRQEVVSREDTLQAPRG